MMTRFRSYSKWYREKSQTLSCFTFPVNPREYTVESIMLSKMAWRSTSGTFLYESIYARVENAVPPDERCRAMVLIRT